MPSLKFTIDIGIERDHVQWIDVQSLRAVDHLVNTASLGHSFFFEEAVDTSVFPHLMVRSAPHSFRVPYISKTRKSTPLQDINFWGNIYPTYVALPYLRRSHGRIVVNASVESWLPLPKMSLYAVITRLFRLLITP